MKTNGEDDNVTEALSSREKLDILLEAISDISNQLEDLRVQQEEIIEKLSNLTIEGSAYGIELLEES